MKPYPADPREARCSRHAREPQAHVWRLGAFYDDGRMRCAYCGKRRKRR